MSSESLFYRKLRELLAGLSRRRRSQLVLMFGLTLVSAIAEVALGAVIPLIAVLASPDVVLHKPITREVVNSLGLGAHDDLRWTVTVLFAVVAVPVGNHIRTY